MKGDQALVDLYRAADIFLSPSIEDAGPMMVSEAMLCGTPVASFDVGFACDLINSSDSGFVVPAKDCAALAESLGYFLSLDSISVKTIAHHARQSAIDRVSPHAEEKHLLSLLNGCIKK
jgi:glycosyltransferase involved in cell wall biosynthesis